MASRAKVRDYNHPDAHLIQVSDSFCNSAERDATDLLAYGFGAPDVAIIRAARNQFAHFPTDIEYEADIIINTQLRDQLISDLASALRNICTRARIGFGEHSAQYRAFAIGSISNFLPDRLLRASTYICALANTQLAALASTGLTTAIITHTQSLAAQLHSTLDERFSLTLIRETATVRRIELGNTLYALLVTLSDKGKLCYRDTSEPKYRHYQISESHSPTDTF